MPERIQRRRARSWRMPEGAIYVGRPSPWGNIVRVGERLRAVDHPEIGWEVADKAEAVGLFRHYALSQARKDRSWLAPLRGHDLVCWCPEPCGVDVALYGVPYGDRYEPCAKPRGHDGGHDPSVPLWCHADVLLELANA